MMNVKGGGILARLSSLTRCGAARSAAGMIERIRSGASGRGRAGEPTQREAGEALKHLLRNCWGQHHPRPQPPVHCHPRPRPNPPCEPPKLDPPIYWRPLPEPCHRDGDGRVPY